MVEPELGLPLAAGDARATSRTPRPRPQQQQRRPPPRLAYLIAGVGPGDGPRIRRLLLALYHPSNCYLVGVAGEDDRADPHAVAPELGREPSAVGE